MRRNLIPWIIMLLILLMDLYGYSSIKAAVFGLKSRTQFIAKSIYWGSTAFIVFFFIYSIIFNLRDNSSSLSRFLLGIVMGIFVSKLLLSIFLLFEDGYRFISFLYQNYIKAEKTNYSSRRQFLNSVFIGVSTLPIAAFIYGMVKTAFDYQIRHIKVPIKNLPKGLQGLKIVQISDLHSGSFSDINPLKKAVELINGLHPDLFFFTGDLVNNRSKEFIPMLEVFDKVKAKYGQFSILGNHDYGDYVDWSTDDEKSKNLAQLKAYHKQVNWNILCNENKILSINGEKLAILGVENWGAKMHFKQYGNLTKAYSGTETISTKILLSHDPSHWDAEVRKYYEDIQLTLSGHTHGMQFGVENKWFKFSPVQWFYEQWAGLYTQDSQHLYVNRGIGFIGYSGRVGIKPEITCITLVSA